MIVVKPEWNRGFTAMTLKILFLWDVKPVKPNYGMFWSDDSETEMIVQFHLQTPDIQLAAENETVILNYDS